MLHDVMGNQAKKLTIQMPISQLQEHRIKLLKEVLNAHKGESQLHFTMYDVEDKVKLNMPSRKQKVAISKELLDELKEKEIVYKLN
jgi:DNA polymerase-3 subunit alpha